MKFTEFVVFYRVRKKVTEQYSGLQVLETIITEAIFFLSGSSFTGIHDSQDNRGGESLSLSLTPLYHFHLLHRHLDISQAITAENSPMHIASRRTWTRNLFFPSANCYPQSYVGSNYWFPFLNFHFTLEPNLRLPN